MENKENVIEYITGTHYATVTFTNEKDINRMKRLYEARPDDFKYFAINDDGSLYAKVPKKWIKVSPPKQMSDEFKQAASERLRKIRDETQR